MNKIMMKPHSNRNVQKERYLKKKKAEESKQRAMLVSFQIAIAEEREKEALMMIEQQKEDALYMLTKKSSFQKLRNTRLQQKVVVESVFPWNVEVNEQTLKEELSKNQNIENLQFNKEKNTLKFELFTDGCKLELYDYFHMQPEYILEDLFFNINWNLVSSNNKKEKQYFLNFYNENKTLLNTTPFVLILNSEENFRKLNTFSTIIAQR